MMARNVLKPSNQIGDSNKFIIGTEKLSNEDILAAVDLNSESSVARYFPVEDGDSYGDVEKVPLHIRAFDGEDYEMVFWKIRKYRLMTRQEQLWQCCYDETMHTKEREFLRQRIDKLQRNREHLANRTESKRRESPPTTAINDAMDKTAGSKRRRCQGDGVECNSAPEKGKAFCNKCLVQKKKRRIEEKVASGDQSYHHIHRACHYEKSFCSIKGKLEEMVQFIEKEGEWSRKETFDKNQQKKPIPNQKQSLSPEKQKKGNVEERQQKSTLLEHSYRTKNYYRKESLVEIKRAFGRKRVDGIKPLGHGRFAAKIKECVAVSDDNPLMEIGNEMLKRIRGITAFQGIAQDTTAERFMHNVFAPCFKAFEAHEGDNNGEITAYYPHQDKVGNLVNFFQVEGSSFVFVAMPSYKKYAGKITTGGSGCLAKYNKWKQKLDKKKQAMVTEFERELAKEVEAARNDARTFIRDTNYCIRVFHMEEGDSLCFAAKTYFHGSIIPPQEDGKRRILLIHHDLELY